MSTTTTVTMTANELKDQGNRLYQAHRYEDAIGSYNKAIIKSPEMQALFTNRALCYLQLKNYEKATADCRKALELDRKNVKAHFFLGRSLIHSEDYDEAIKSIVRAAELAKNQKMHFGDEIMSTLRSARREKFRLEEEKRISQELELQKYVNRLIKEDKEKQLHSLNHDEDEPPSKEEIVKVRLEKGAEFYFVK